MLKLNCHQPYGLCSIPQFPRDTIFSRWDLVGFPEHIGLLDNEVIEKLYKSSKLLEPELDDFTAVFHISYLEVRMSRATTAPDLTVE